MNRNESDVGEIATVTAVAEPSQARASVDSFGPLISL